MHCLGKKNYGLSCLTSYALAPKPHFEHMWTKSLKPQSPISKDTELELFSEIIAKFKVLVYY